MRTERGDLFDRQHTFEWRHRAATGTNGGEDFEVGSRALPFRRREVDRARSVRDHRQATGAVFRMTLRARLRIERLRVDNDAL